MAPLFISKFESTNDYLYRDGSIFHQRKIKPTQNTLGKCYHTLNAFFNLNNEGNFMYKKQFKKFCKGEPTKKYLKGMRLEQMSEKGYQMYMSMA